MLFSSQLALNWSENENKPKTKSKKKRKGERKAILFFFFFNKPFCALVYKRMITCSIMWSVYDVWLMEKIYNFYYFASCFGIMNVVGTFLKAHTITGLTNGVVGTLVLCLGPSFLFLLIFLASLGCHWFSWFWKSTSSINIITRIVGFLSRVFDYCNFFCCRFDSHYLIGCDSEFLIL